MKHGTLQVTSRRIPAAPFLLLVLASALVPALRAQQLDRERGPALVQNDDLVRSGEKDTDDPRARLEYLEKMRGKLPAGRSAGALRLQGVEQRDRMSAQQGQQFWQSATRGPEPSTVSINGTWMPIGPSASNSNFGSSTYPFTSGRVTAIAVDPSSGPGYNRVYVGGAQGGVWKTTDGGLTWTPLTDSQPSLAIGALAVDSAGVIYAGTGEQSFSQDSYYGAGILKSTDGGQSWTVIGSSAFNGSVFRSGYLPSIGGLAVRPGADNTILAAVLTNGVASGIYRTTDGGANWTQVYSSSSGSTPSANSVAYAPNNGNVAFAGSFAEGVIRSMDGGATWASISTGLGITASSGRVEIAVYSDSVVFAAIANDATGALQGLYRSTNANNATPGLVTWTNLLGSGGLTDFCSSQCWYDLVVAVNPAVPVVPGSSGVIFAGGSGFPNNNFLYRSVDGGATWSLATGSNFTVHADQHAMAFTPDGATMYLGNDGGLSKTNSTTSASGSVVWTDLNQSTVSPAQSLNITQFYRNFALHPTDVNKTLGGAQDNGTQRYAGVLTWDGITCGDGAGAVYSVTAPETNVFVNCQNIDIRRSTSGGAIGSFTSATTGISDSSLFIPPLVGDPANGAVLYFGGKKIWRTANNAASWSAISVLDLTSGAGGHGISAIAVAPSDTNVIFVGTSNGLVWKGTASNVSASLTAANTLAGGNPITAIAVDPTNSANVFITVATFFGSRVLRSTNGGTNWADVSGNLPNIPANDVAVDPDDPTVVYVAMDAGVFSTVNAANGSTWSVVGNGLPNVAIFGLKFHKPSRTLRAATHGRGMWDLYVPYTVVGAGALLNPTSVLFGNQRVSVASAATGITLTNNGTVTTSISGIGLIGTNAADFSFTLSGCASSAPPFNLGAGQSCTIQVTFTPGGIGSRSATLSVTSNAVNGTQTAALSGTGDNPAPNDDVTNPTIVTQTPFTDTVTTFNATIGPNDPFPPGNTCVLAGDDTRNHSVWYAYTPSANGNATFDTGGSDYDTVLSVWTTSSARRGTFTNIACNDDGLGPAGPSQISNLAVTAGQRYLIMASGYAPSNSGVLTFNLSGPAPAAPGGVVLTTTLQRPLRTARTSSSDPLPVTTGAERTVTFQVAAPDHAGETATVRCESPLPGVTCRVEPQPLVLEEAPMPLTIYLRATPQALAGASRRALRLATRPVDTTVTVAVEVGGRSAEVTLPIRVR